MHKERKVLLFVLGSFCMAIKALLSDVQAKIPDANEHIENIAISTI